MILDISGIHTFARKTIEEMDVTKEGTGLRLILKPHTSEEGQTFENGAQLVAFLHKATGHNSRLFGNLVLAHLTSI